MKTLGEVKTTDRGFEVIDTKDADGDCLQLGQSSRCDDLVAKPGTSYLWIGVSEPKAVAVLARDQALALRNHLDAWLRTGSLVVDEAEEPWVFAVECPEQYAEKTGMGYALCYDVETAEGVVNDIRHETGETDAKIIELWPRGE